MSNNLFEIEADYGYSYIAIHENPKRLPLGPFTFLGGPDYPTEPPESLLEYLEYRGGGYRLRLIGESDEVIPVAGSNDADDYHRWNLRRR